MAEAGLIVAYVFGFLGLPSIVGLGIYLISKMQLENIPEDAAIIKNEAYEITRTPRDGILHSIVFLPNNKAKISYYGKYINEDTKIYETIIDRNFYRFIPSGKNGERNEYRIFPKNPDDYNKALFSTEYGKMLGQESILARQDKNMTSVLLETMKANEQLMKRNRFGEMTEEELQKALDLIKAITVQQDQRTKII